MVALADHILQANVNQVHKLTQTMDEWEIGLAVIAEP